MADLAVEGVLDLPPAPEAAAAARRYVRQQLTRWQLEDLLEPVLLLTSELVTNAILHAGTRLTVCVQREGIGVRVEVRDGSTVPPRRRRRSFTATTGRGVQLLESLSDRWGARTFADGKLVWFTVLAAVSWADALELDDLL